MMSISAMANGSMDYFLSLARPHYYTEGGEPPGQWFGAGAAQLGLTGTVTADEINHLFRGFDPKGNALVQNAGAKDRQPGWDLTFSAPKTVSILWGLGDESTRKTIQAAHADAVRAALTYLESEFAESRVGKGGTDRVTCGLVASLFEHGSSRNHDPNLHTHAVVLNAGFRQARENWGTVLSKPFYQAKMAAGAIYRSELSHRLQQELPVAMRAEKTWFEVQGVPDAVRDAFSTRRTEIENALAEKGHHSAQASEVAALATRKTKTELSRTELFARWQHQAADLGFDPRLTKDMLANMFMTPSRRRLESEAARTVVRLTESRNYFTRKDFIRVFAERTVVSGVGANAIIAQANRILSSPSLRMLGSLASGETAYTTNAVLRREARIIEMATAPTAKASLGTPEMVGLVVESQSRRGVVLNDGQRRALEAITQSPGGPIRLINGWAGTGKTTMLAAAREIWVKAGFDVVGAALSGKAAHGLQEGSGIPSETIHRRLRDWDGDGRSPGQTPYERPQPLTKNSILVIDEASMVGTKLLGRTLEHARRAGASVVLIGDFRQLQSIDAGGAFKSLIDRVGCAELDVIVRQRDAWAVQAVRDAAVGNAKAVLNALGDHERLHVRPDRDRAIAKLADDWSRGGVRRPQDHLIFTATNHDAATINRECQRRRQDAGLVSRRGIVVNGQFLGIGDRVLFTRNSKMFKVKNGSLGTISRVNTTHGSVTVNLDGVDQPTTIVLKDYDHLRLGYALTTHKGQGVSVENSYILAGGAMTTRELTYVQLSRSRAGTHLYVDRSEAGPELEELIQAMETSRPQVFATDIKARHERQDPLGPAVVGKWTGVDPAHLSSPWNQDRRTMGPELEIAR